MGVFVHPGRWEAEMARKVGFLSPGKRGGERSNDDTNIIADLTDSVELCGAFTFF